jgi:hypothetical protein
MMVPVVDELGDVIGYVDSIYLQLDPGVVGDGTGGGIGGILELAITVALIVLMV